MKSWYRGFKENKKILSVQRGSPGLKQGVSGV